VVFLVVFFLGVSFVTSFCLQKIVTQINHAIGAEGYVSYECKSIIHNYGDSIWEYI